MLLPQNNNNGERPLFEYKLLGKNALVLFQLKRIRHELNLLAEDDYFGKLPCISWYGFSQLSVVPQTIYPKEALVFLDERIESMKLENMLETTPIPPQKH